MSTLHGNWILSAQHLFIWGETWKAKVVSKFSPEAEDINDNYLCLEPEELLSYLESLEFAWQELVDESISTRWTKQIVKIPSQVNKKKKEIFPLSSLENLEAIANDSLSNICWYPWQIQGVYLKPKEAIKFLQSLPLGSLNHTNFSGELRFWAQIYRWSLDLLARKKYLPTIEGNNSVWQPLLDSVVDRTRLAKFSKLMPLVCVSYNKAENIDGQQLILNFLAIVIDRQIRNWQEKNETNLKASNIQFWLKSLQETSSLLLGNEKQKERLATALDNWTLPIQEYLISSNNNSIGQNFFRTCVRLQPPEKPEDDWQLIYHLQAIDEPDFLLDSETIWQYPVAEITIDRRTIKNPQETLLKGLGLALRLYPKIAESLATSQPTFCNLNPIEVYEFIRSIAWQLEENGLGVILPSGLTPGSNEQRLGINIKAEVKGKKGERLNLKSLLDFKLELAVGEQTISQKEFEQLLAKKSPLVEINGQWLALQPADVRAAQAVLQQSIQGINLSVEDALRLSTGDTKTLAKLPVVKFEAAGILQELINNLTENKSLEPLEKITGFVGELRPYQAKGISWLAFLEKWGLGACLADDMGLGKCLSKDSLIIINSNIYKAEEIWQTHAVEAEFDGEGYWSVTSESLLVNAIDEKTGKIVLAPIQRLYRQYVCEKLRQIKLKDGSTITITQRHKLLTNNGWTNHFKVGDYVCVPAKLVWNGKAQDPDFVKFLAWQIAEGYENKETGSLHITQKDAAILEELRLTIHRLSKKYGMKINHPTVNIPNNNRTADLRLTSRAYQRFLEARGYKWGNLSREKSIPPFIMQADLDSVGIFLRNYFDAEGSVILSMRSVEISTASPQIIQQLSTLLRRFGIWLRIVAKQKCATNGNRIYRTYYIGTLGGNSARRFYEDIGFGIAKKQRKLEAICQKVTNINVESIPASDIFAEAVQETKLPLRHFGVNSNVYINGLQQFSRNSLEKVIAGFDNILSGESEQQYRQLKLSKWTTQTLDAYAQLDVQQLSLTKQRLQYLINQEVFYCQIESIEDVDYNDWVYDFEVSEHHNFVANNILCHNTIQTIAFMLHLQEKEALEAPVLLVCPTSVLGNWEREVKKFGPTIKTLVHHGDKRTKGKALVKAVKDKNLVITSYPLVFRDAKDLQSITWQGVVLDEAQNIKNPTAKQSQAVKNLPGGFRIALTGTPVENRLAELWSILDFLNPGFLGSRQFFQKRFAMPIEKYGDRESLNILRSLTQPFILRRLKTDKEIIQDLPEKQETNVYCGLASMQAEIYQKLVEESLQTINESEGIKRRGLILTLLLKLKQLCNHPDLLAGKTTIEKQEEFAKQSGKVLRLEEILEEILAEEDRALIFTQFAEWGKLLQTYLQKKFKQEIIFLYGATRREKRQEMVDRFQNDVSGPKIFILSLKAGGIGLNLTKANHVFHIDRWWNPAVENQATDRAFRIGQKRNVQVHKFVCTGTLEERIDDLITSKKELAEQTVDSGENWLTELDTDRLRNLLLLDRDKVIDD